MNTQSIEPSPITIKYELLNVQKSKAVKTTFLLSQWIINQIIGNGGLDPFSIKWYARRNIFFSTYLSLPKEYLLILPKCLQ